LSTSPTSTAGHAANARRSAEAHKRAEIRGELQSKVIAEMIKSLSSGVPKERAMEKAFKAGAYWWQIGRAFRHVAADRLRDGEAREEETCKEVTATRRRSSLRPHPEGAAEGCVSKDGAATDRASCFETLAPQQEVTGSARSCSARTELVLIQEFASDAANDHSKKDRIPI
jgi:hypothetical protein